MPVIGVTRQPYLAVYATFVAMGLWHGISLSWLCWGLYQATGVAIHQTWSRIKRKRGWVLQNTWPTRVAGAIATLLFVTAGHAFVVVVGAELAPNRACGSSRACSRSMSDSSGAGRGHWTTRYARRPGLPSETAR